MKNELTKFILLSQPRSGTHWLRTALSFHPDIHCASEVFHPKPDLIENPKETRASVLRGDFGALLGSGGVGGETCVGFVLQVEQLLTNRPRRFRKLRGLRIVELRRMNLLARFLSRKVAERSGKWRDRVYGPDDDPIALDVRELLRDFKHQERARSKAARVFRDAERLVITYEALREDFHGTMDPVQRFLGVEPRELETDLVKQERRPIAEAIANFEEVCAALAGTRWHSFVARDATR